jgi:hypothetical protein
LSKPSVNPPATPHTVDASEGLPIHAPIRGRHLDQPWLGELDGELVLSGWVVGEEPIERVVATAGGRPLAHVRVDRPRADIAKAFPDLESAESSGFRMLLPAGVLQRAEEVLVEVIVGDGPPEPIWSVRLGYCGEHADSSPPKRSKSRRRWSREKERDVEPTPDVPKDSFRVVALISTFNEADIIDPVLEHLHTNGVSSYLIDNESTDETVERARKWVGRGLLGIESIGTASGGRTSWKAILERKVELTRELGADWYIHHDADEVRESPWPGMSLRDAIRHVDGLGYNAIDFRVLNFPPVDDAFRSGDDPRTHFSRWEDPAEYDRLQRKCWKAGFSGVALEDGGHDVRFPERRLFPLRFLLRHYPIRSQAHGTRKVMRERKQRFVPEEVGMGWHRQYDGISGVDHQFLRSPGSLKPFNLDRIRLETALEDGRDASAPTVPGIETPEEIGARGCLDQAGPEKISGWAASANGRTEPVTVQVWDGDRVIATEVAHRYRADLKKQGVAGGHAGFTIRTPRALLDGRPHWVWVTVAGTALRRSPLVLRSDARPASTGNQDESEAVA